MKKYWWVICICLAVAILIAGFFLWRYYKNRQSGDQQPSPSTTFSTSNSGNQMPSTSPAPTLVYPISDFSARATTNLFGTFYPVGGSTHPDRSVCPTATYYSGYHTAVDLETFPAEANQAVTVRSIAKGTIRQAGNVNGYGGLVIIEYDLGGASYSGIYGHLDLSTVNLRVGAEINTGDKIGELAEACSQANSDVRKHLHFGLHKGTTIDERGYVPTKTDLSAWADPVALLTSLGAAQ